MLSECSGTQLGKVARFAPSEETTHQSRAGGRSLAIVAGSYGTLASWVRSARCREC